MSSNGRCRRAATWQQGDVNAETTGVLLSLSCQEQLSSALAFLPCSPRSLELDKIRPRVDPDNIWDRIENKMWTENVFYDPTPPSNLLTDGGARLVGPNCPIFLVVKFNRSPPQLYSSGSAPATCRTAAHIQQLTQQYVITDFTRDFMHVGIWIMEWREHFLPSN